MLRAEHPPSRIQPLQLADRGQHLRKAVRQRLLVLGYSVGLEIDQPPCLLSCPAGDGRGRR